jgi:mRNA interferase RelE/StbE
LPKIEKTGKKKIQPVIETKPMTQPEIFGKPLRRSLKNYKKLKVGEYKVMFRIEDQSLKVFIIKLRSVVHLNNSKRI